MSLSDKVFYGRMNLRSTSVHKERTNRGCVICCVREKKKSMFGLKCG